MTLECSFECVSLKLRRCSSGIPFADVERGAVRRPLIRNIAFEQYLTESLETYSLEDRCVMQNNHQWLSLISLPRLPVNFLLIVTDSHNLVSKYVRF